MRDDVIAAMAECPSVCEQLHLPLQSGSTRILKAMRRTYSRQRYLELVERIRDAVPGHRADDRHHRRLPGRDRGRLRRDARGGGRGVATTTPSPSSTRPGAAPTRPRWRTRCPRTSSASGSSGWSISCRSTPPATTLRWSAPCRRSWSRAEAEPTTTVWRGRTRTNKTVNFTGSAEPGALVDVLVERSSSQTLAGRAAAFASRVRERAWPSSARPRRARARRHSSWPCALDGEIVSCDAMQMYRGLPILTNQPTRSRAGGRPAPPGRRLAARAPRARWPSSPSWRGRRSTRSLREAASPILCGGSGLYLRAALAPMDAATRAGARHPRPPRDALRRAGTGRCARAALASATRPRRSASIPTTAGASCARSSSPSRDAAWRPITTPSGTVLT